MITLIAAVAKNGCIGKEGKLPWSIPLDMARLVQRTQGHVVIMGRKTWESLPEEFRPLPHRKNVIVTRQSDYANTTPPGVEVFHSIERALSAHADDNVFVIGGGEIFKQTIDWADKMFITVVNQTIRGDVFFPRIVRNQWEAQSVERYEGFAFVIYDRVKVRV